MNNLDTVVMASVESAHMCVQAEGINMHEQPIKCYCKNDMQCAGFYEMTIVLLAASVKGYANHNLLATSTGASRQGQEHSGNDGDDLLSLARLIMLQDQRQREVDREQQQRWREEERRQREQDRADDRERSNRLFELLAAALAGITRATQANQGGN
ncbi:hypothetical protein ON010_g5608 [Phytophthora cinnamomi]|nr:hypothetical protein ON010_g5608 [Phytophthora cinnamomi]